MTKKQIKKFLKGLDTEIDILNYVDVEDIDFNDPYYSIYYQLREKNAFEDVSNVIYYSEAIKFLAKTDTSLTRSLELASELGFEVGNLNSEILASLLKTRMLEDEFAELQSEIESTLQYESLEEEDGDSYTYEEMMDILDIEMFEDASIEDKNRYIDICDGNESIDMLRRGFMAYLGMDIDPNVIY